MHRSLITCVCIGISLKVWQSAQGLENQFFSFLLRLIYETLKFKQYLALSQKFEGMFVLFNDIAGFIQSKEGGGREGDRMTARGWEYIVPAGPRSPLSPSFVTTTETLECYLIFSSAPNTFIFFCLDCKFTPSKNTPTTNCWNILE